MSHSNDPTSSTGSRQEPPKTIQDDGYFVFGSNETRMPLSDVPIQNQKQRDQQGSHQDSSFLHSTQTNMNTNAFFEYPLYFGRATMNTGGTLFNPNQHNPSLGFGFNMGSQRTTGFTMIPTYNDTNNGQTSNYGNRYTAINNPFGSSNINPASFPVTSPPYLVSIDKRQQLPPSASFLHVSTVNSSLPREPHWTTTLTKNDMYTKLYPDAQFVEDHILKHLPEPYRIKISETGPGVMVKVYDRDTNTTHDICLGMRYGVKTQLALYTNPWIVEKKLHKTHIRDSLFLSKNFFDSYILKYISEDEQKTFRESGEMMIGVYDTDTHTTHEMLLARAKKYESYGLKCWHVDFVKRRCLKIGDKVGFYWDRLHSTLNFRVLSRAVADK